MPMPGSQLTTSWIRVATEGETVDGRRIEAQWLIDMAESYNTDTYTALIWPEHERWFGSHGEVLELHSERVDGLQRLFAKLCPSVYLIQANQDGQLLFCSIEPTESLNFRGTGKPYLEGLGVTNSPASIGTERLRFKSEKSGRLYGALEPLVIHEVTEEGTTVAVKDKKKPYKAVSAVRRLFSLEDDTPTEPENPTADQTLEEKLTALASAIAEFDVRLTALEETKADVIDVETLEKTVTEVELTVTEVQEVVDSADFKSLRANIKTIVGNFSKLDQVVTQLPSGVPPTTGNTTNFNLV